MLFASKLNTKYLYIGEVLLSILLVLQLLIILIDTSIKFGLRLLGSLRRVKNHYTCELTRVQTDNWNFLTFDQQPKDTLILYVINMTGKRRK